MKSRVLFPIAIGLSDGIITALMLTSAELLHSGTVGLLLAMRIAFGSAFVGAFSFFIAEYSRLRGELSRASKQLTLPHPSYLVKSRLGKEILLESTVGTTLSGACGFAGALIPLMVSVAIPYPGWVSVITAIASLGLLGIGLGKTVLGKYLNWAIAMILIGVVVTIAGSVLQIVG